MNTGIKRVLLLLMMVVLVMASVTCVFANPYPSEAYDTDITKEFGTLTGSSRILKNTDKFVSLLVRTTNKAPHFCLKYDIQYSPSGITITANELNDINVGSDGKTSAEDIEMHHWFNKETNKRDGFLNTTIVSFSTHEARGNISSYVYLATSA